MVAIVPGMNPRKSRMESQMMMSVECPWCDGTATVEVVDGEEFNCPGCAIRVELAPDPITEPATRAA